MPLNWPAHFPIDTVSWTTPMNVSDGLEVDIRNVGNGVGRFNANWGTDLGAA